VATAARRAFNAVGSTVLLNDNAPDQSLLHVHIHVIPRFGNDGLVIPNVGQDVAPRDLRLELVAKLKFALAGS
jgi:histidine triad (HIT) family protein